MAKIFRLAVMTIIFRIFQKSLKEKGFISSFIPRNHKFVQYGFA